MYYKELNCYPKTGNLHTVERVEIHNVCGQRYIGTDLDTNIQITFTEPPETTLAPS